MTGTRRSNRGSKRTPQQWLPALQESGTTHLTRGISAPAMLERFLVSAVVAVLLIRGWLELTGYPQIGGHGLHIAHMLFGGIGMLIALLASLTLLGPRARAFGAIVGGAGFGTFIDELGKFITSDNDYFYRPTVALIYVIFVLLFIAGERLAAERNPAPDERLAQALDVTTGAVLERYPAPERDLAMQLLAECDPANPLVPALQRALERIAAEPNRPKSLAQRVMQRLTRAYWTLTSQDWFLRLVLAVAGLVTLFSLRELSVTVFADPEHDRFMAYVDSTGGLLLFVNLIAGALLIIGLMHMRGPNLDAYEWFRRAVLVSLLVAQPLAFYEQQLTALVGLAINLALLSALDFAISRESPVPGAPTDSTLQDAAVRRSDVSTASSLEGASEPRP
jgi:hypothetical protein